MSDAIDGFRSLAPESWGLRTAGTSPAPPVPDRRGSARAGCLGLARGEAGPSPFNGGGIFQQSGGFLLLLKKADAWKSEPFAEA